MRMYASELPRTLVTGNSVNRELGLDVTKPSFGKLNDATRYAVVIGRTLYVPGVSEPERSLLVVIAVGLTIDDVEAELLRNGHHAHTPSWPQGTSALRCLNRS